MAWAATLKQKLYLSRTRVLMRRAGIRRALELVATLRAFGYRLRYRLRPSERAMVRIREQAARFVVSSSDEMQRVQTLGGEKKFLERLLEEVRSGDVAYDIGTSLGLHTVFLAKAVGDAGCVIGFEPEARSYQRCRENLRLNALHNVRLFDCALADEENEVQLVVGESAASGVHHVQRRGDGHAHGWLQPIRLVVGDRFIAGHGLPAPDVLKLDVEGMEEEVLRGLAETLRRPNCRLVLCEVHFAILDQRGRWDAPRRIQEFLVSCGFGTVDWLNSGHLLARKDAPSACGGAPCAKPSVLPKRLDPTEHCVVCGHTALSAVYQGLRFRKKPLPKTYAMARCTRCRLLQVSPRPDPAELAEFYRDTDYWAEELVVRSPGECRLETDILSRLGGYVRCGRVLDVGCGAGHFLNCARRRGWETYGVEIAPHSAEFARASYGLSVLTQPIEELSFSAGFFDLITLIGVIEHLPHPMDFLRRLHPLLKPGGVLFLLTDNGRSWLHWLMREQFPWINPPEHLQLFSPRSIQALLEPSGFATLRVESQETIPEDAAIRGLAALLRRNGRQVSESGALRKGIRPLLWISYPMRWLLWQMNLGAQLYVFARKSDSGGSKL